MFSHILQLNFELSIDPDLFSHYFHELAKHPIMSKCSNCNPHYGDPTQHVASAPGDTEAVAAVSESMEIPGAGTPIDPMFVYPDEDDQEMVEHAGEQSRTSYRRSSIDPVTQLQVTTLPPADNPVQTVPSIRRSFGVSVSSRQSFEETLAEVRMLPFLCRIVAINRQNLDFNIS